MFINKNKKEIEPHNKVKEKKKILCYFTPFPFFKAPPGLAPWSTWLRCTQSPGSPCPRPGGTT